MVSGSTPTHYVQRGIGIEDRPVPLLVVAFPGPRPHGTMSHYAPKTDQRTDRDQTPNRDGDKEQHKNTAPDGDRTPTRGELERHYWIAGETQTEIAERYGTTQVKVSEWMRQCDIPTREPFVPIEDQDIPPTLSILSGEGDTVYPPTGTSADLSMMQRDILIVLGAGSDSNPNSDTGWGGGGDDGDGGDSDASAPDPHPGPTGAAIRDRLAADGRHTEASRPLIYSHLRQLEREGYIDSEGHPQDRRANCYSITERGWELIDNDTEWLVDTLTSDWSASTSGEVGMGD